MLPHSIVDNEAIILESCKRDLNKSRYETYVCEIDWCKNDILFVLKNLAKWIKDEPATDTSLMNKFMAPKVRKDPLGAVLVIGAYNFPVQLSLGPLIGAIAAGNTAVLKPSEQAPNVAVALAKVIAAIDDTCYGTVQGGVEETTALLEEKWDKIFYTGGQAVGIIIAKKAAETLTPVTLELGGKNPAFVTRNADLRLAARRLLWAKFLNAGQVCISQNYTLVDRDVMEGFKKELKKALAEFMPNGAKGNPDMSKIATLRQWQRLKKLLDTSNGTIIQGGSMDESSQFLEPTVVEVSDINDPLIQEETFGPILTLFPVSSLDEALRIANEVDPTPLGTYPFGNKAETDKVLAELRSGGATVNDGFFHGAIPTLAFGGVGTSGQGAYRGRTSFECFTHRRSIAKTPGWMEGLLDVRYPPYGNKLGKLQAMNNVKPNFDREGNVAFNPLKYVLFLGANGVGGGLVRYALVALGK